MRVTLKGGYWYIIHILSISYIVIFSDILVGRPSALGGSHRGPVDVREADLTRLRLQRDRLHHPGRGGHDDVGRGARVKRGRRRGHVVAGLGQGGGGGVAGLIAVGGGAVVDAAGLVAAVRGSLLGAGLAAARPTRHVNAGIALEQLIENWDDSRFNRSSTVCFAALNSIFLTSSSSSSSSVSLPPSPALLPNDSLTAAASEEAVVVRLSWLPLW